MNSQLKNKLFKLLPLVLCIAFFLGYATLSIVKHQHFLSGYDLAVTDQAIWKYSQLASPVMTIHAYHDTPVYFDHFEPILAVISPLFWILPDTKVLLLLQVLAVTGSGYVIFLLAIKKKIIFPVAISLLITYLAFYGIQNAIWADFHTNVLAIPFLALFIFVIEQKKHRLATIPFLFAIICKEDIALFTFLIAGVQFFFTREKKLLLFMAGSVIYLMFVFGIFFPFFTEGYRFQNSQGLLSSVDLNNFYNTSEKREAIFYSLAGFGFIPLFAPVYLILFAADLGHYFVLGSDYVSSAQGLFLHYRSTLALFLAWPAIIAISKFKFLNKSYIALYLLVCALVVQYVLHLPLSYLTKSWFWQQPAAVNDINKAISILPDNASLATQVNISPHLTHRARIYTLWPIEKDFEQNSPCGSTSCQWFRIGNNVEYILVDTSASWDARHLLVDREKFAEGVENLEKAGVVKKVFRQNNTTLYKRSGKI